MLELTLDHPESHSGVPVFILNGLELINSHVAVAMILSLTDTSIPKLLHLSSITDISQYNAISASLTLISTLDPQDTELSTYSTYVETIGGMLPVRLLNVAYSLYCENTIAREIENKNSKIHKIELLEKFHKLKQKYKSQKNLSTKKLTKVFPYTPTSELIEFQKIQKTLSLSQKESHEPLDGDPLKHL